MGRAWDEQIEKAKSLPINGLIHIGPKVKGGHVLDCVFIDPGVNCGIFINGDSQAAKKNDPRFVARGVLIARAEVGHLIMRLRALPERPPMWRLISLWRWHKERSEILQQLTSPSWGEQGCTIHAGPSKEGLN